MDLPTLLRGAWKVQKVSITREAAAPVESFMGHDGFASGAVRLCLSLLVTYRDNSDVTYFLLRIVWRGEITGFLDQIEQIATQATDLYVRLLALRAVAVLGAETVHE